MTNYKYYKINNTNSQDLEDYMNENRIPFTKYNDILKVVCDEESKRMLEHLEEHYRDNQLNSLADKLLDHTDDLSNVLFNNDNDLLDYFHFQSVFDKYIERNGLDE